jgi:hypothetical protein
MKISRPAIIGLHLVVIASAGAFLRAESSTFMRQESNIDRRSYDLGIIAAFSEVVGAGVKKLALSDVLTPEAADALIDDARQIAARNGVELYREPSLIVTDLFPADVAAGKHVLLIYKGTTLGEYLGLKADKASLEKAGKYTPAAHLEIARRFGRLLSYPDQKIDQLLKAR